MPAGPALEKLVSTWRAGLGGTRRRAGLALLVAVVLCGAQLARIGTPLARGVTALAIALVLALLVVFWWRERRRFADMRHMIASVLMSADRPLAERSLRALNLVERTGRDETLGSNTLAQLHFERVLARARPERVAEAAARRARRFRTLALALLACALLALALGPLRSIEGLDVLVARGGVAPLPLRWLDQVRIASQAPQYLRKGESPLYQGFENEQPNGSVLSVRGL
ncbi:MAG TPA: DUF4175 domain-containing protein, partial [Polyangiaceae bacterium]|nr:DUF4175 domain-containing protein [Polyangiaceae bacterium]